MEAYLRRAKVRHTQDCGARSPAAARTSLQRYGFAQCQDDKSTNGSPLTPESSRKADISGLIDTRYCGTEVLCGNVY
jgi:hypothetical protein